MFGIRKNMFRKMRHFGTTHPQKFLPQIICTLKYMKSITNRAFYCISVLILKYLFVLLLLWILYLQTHITRVHKQEFVDEMVIRYNDVAPMPTIDPSEAVDGVTNPYVRSVYQCKVCQRELQWKSRSTWKTHYESHLDIKRFGCYVCEKQFRMKGDLKTHIVRVHKVEFIDEKVIRLEENTA